MKSLRYYLDLITDLSTEIPLIEQAFSRKEQIRKVRSQTWTLFDHIMKVMNCNDPMNDRGWAKEIRASIKNIKVRSNVLLSADYVFEVLFIDEIGSRFDQAMKEFNDDYSCEIRSTETDLKSVYRWLSEVIADQKIAVPSEDEIMQRLKQ